MGYSTWGCKELGTTERLHLAHSQKEGGSLSSDEGRMSTVRDLRTALQRDSLHLVLLRRGCPDRGEVEDRCCGSDSHQGRN